MRFKKRREKEQQKNMVNGSEEEPTLIEKSKCELVFIAMVMVDGGWWLGTMK